eukprot:jgi/Undpi1/1841/HiC_scaffold_12.g05228.m1
MTTSYAPVARSNSSMKGQPAAAEDHFKGPKDSGGGSGVARTAWWWAAGPVDSCCFFCRLRIGMGLLAASNLIHGIFIIFFMDALQSSDVANRISALREEYLIACKFLDSKSLEHCKELNNTLDQMENGLKQLVVIFVAQGMLCFVTSAVGLWAVLYNSPRAAKVYMLSWTAHFLCWALLSWSKTHADASPDGTHVFTRTAHALFLVYYFKVSWSFYKLTMRDREKSAHDSSDSPDAEEQEQTKDKTTLEMTRRV